MSILPFSKALTLDLIPTVNSTGTSIDDQYHPTHALPFFWSCLFVVLIVQPPELQMFQVFLLLFTIASFGKVDPNHLTFIISSVRTYSGAYKYALLEK